MTESAYSPCCANKLIKHYVKTEGNHGREGTRFDHYTCGACGRVCGSVVFETDIVRRVLEKMSIRERHMIARLA